MSVYAICLYRIIFRNFLYFREKSLIRKLELGVFCEMSMAFKKRDIGFGLILNGKVLFRSSVRNKVFGTLLLLFGAFS